MNYHNITKEDMLNGPGLRVVLWTAGCEHHCKGCQNPITWDPNGGLEFTSVEFDEIVDAIDHDYIAGITYSGGDPLHPHNRAMISFIAEYIRKRFPDKTQWLYTGYSWENIKDLRTIQYLDVVVTEKFDTVQRTKDLAAHKDPHWCGSSNQMLIDVKESLSNNMVIFWKDHWESKFK